MLQPLKTDQQPVQPRGRAVRLGEILQRQGAIAQSDLKRGLALRAKSSAPLGEVLRSEGLITPATLTTALARQDGRLAIDLDRFPPDPTLCEGMNPRHLLRLGLLPWRWVDARLVCVIAAPQDIERAKAMLPHSAPQVTFALAERAQIDQQIARVFGDQLAGFAAERCPSEMSCRTWAGPGASLPRWLTLGGLVGAAAIAPLATLALVLVWIAIMNAVTTLLRAVALVDSLGPTKRPKRYAQKAPAPLPPGGLPVVSVLVPLFDEDLTLQHLLDALDRQTYPKALLDVVFVLEEDDYKTPLVLAQIGLPPWARMVTMPAAPLRTKPRAMNYALEFCRGSVIGIYDAEDRPEPDQLSRIVDHLGGSPAEVGCVQGYLDFYNPRQNWLARCFTIEYAIWFRVLLGGLQRLGVPIPLGGTTVFFRRSALEAVGAWDAHNVTEDADLGMRLARFGYCTEMVPTTTLEEANCMPGAWIKQRSRWLKGYAMTWVTHMRHPRALWRDLGPRGFFGFQVLLLGGLTAYLATPLFWGIWLGWWGFGLPLEQWAPPQVWWAFFSSMILGQAVMLTVAVRAVWARKRGHLIPWIILLPIYWPLGAVAAYRAVVEMFTKPFHWSKTTHGL